MSIFLFKELLEKKLNSTINIENFKSFGEVSDIYKVISNNKAYILKVNTLENYENFLKEKWCSDKCKEFNIETPKIYFVDKTGLQSLLLLEFIEGINCFELENEELKNKIYKYLGVLSRKISEISVSENIGDLKTVENTKRWFIEDYINFEIAQTESKNDYLIINQIDREKILNNLYFIKDIKFEFSLCHGDLSLKNCLYNKERNKFILLDFGSAETQPKYYFELMLKWLELNYDKTISEENFMNFANGLLGENYNEWLKENIKMIEAFALLYVLDKYRWAHDRSTREWQDKYLLRLSGVLNLVR